MSKGGSKEIPETEEERALAGIARARLQDFQERFIPFENEFIENLEVTEADRVDMRGITSNAVNREFDDVQNQSLQQQAAQGANPNSGRFKAALNKVIQKRGLSLGSGLANANANMDRKQITNLESGIALGRGQSADAFQGMADIAADAQQRSVDDARNWQQNRRNTAGALGSVIGAGVRYNNEDSGG